MLVAAAVLFLLTPIFLAAGSFSHNNPVTGDSSTFLVNRFAATGVLSETLEKSCAEQQWATCRREALVKENIGNKFWFLWKPDSPLQTEFEDKWFHPETKSLALHALRCCSPKILWTTLLGSWEAFWTVDSSFDLTQYNAKVSNEILRWRRHPDESRAAQARVWDSETPIRPLLHPFPERPLLACLLLVTIGLVAWCGWRGDREGALFLIVLVAFLVLHALVIAFAGGPLPRLQGRVAWLIPWGSLVVLARCCVLHVHRKRDGAPVQRRVGET